MDVLIDTSFLFAVLYARDKYHARASEAMRTKLRQATNRIVLEPILQELFFLASGRLNHNHALNMLIAVENSVFTPGSLIDEDRQRWIDIMQQYQSAQFDYADAAIMAVSERLNITQVYTFDRRDFPIFRPKHCDYLELLPS